VFSILIEGNFFADTWVDCQKFLAWAAEKQIILLGAEGFQYDGSTGGLRVVEGAVLDSSPGLGYSYNV